MTKCAFYTTTSQSAGEGKGNKWVDDDTYIHMDVTRQIDRTSRIDTTNKIEQGFIRIRIIRVLMGKVML